MFTQPDVDDSNFRVCKHERTTLVYFSNIGLLPYTFVPTLNHKHGPIPGLAG